MPIQQMIAEMNAMMAALQLVANIIGIVAVSIFSVYAIVLTALALSERLKQTSPLTVKPGADPRQEVAADFQKSFA